ncbi:alpha/beta hydrolase [Chloroflexota bacterium]
MNQQSRPLTGSSEWVDQIPVLWFEPLTERPERQLIILLPGLSSTKESMTPYLEELAAEGFVALSFDPWQHGERGTETQAELGARVFGNFRRHMWPILGQSTLDSLRVIDWAVEEFQVKPPIFMGGISMGGDIAVAAAGIDHRIQRILAVVATPDWLRPGMQDIFNPGTLLPQGEPDAYAQFFFDLLNPMNHLANFVNGPKINFVCGEQDTHVPPDGAIQFQAALREVYPDSDNLIEVNIFPGLGHMDFSNRELWWPESLEWLKRS